MNGFVFVVITHHNRSSNKIEADDKNKNVYIWIKKLVNEIPQTSTYVSKKVTRNDDDTA